ncbi:hypothetical protein D9M68_708750 [compost metagenome]
MSSISPMHWPAETTPLCTSPDSSAARPRAPATSGRMSSNSQPPGRRSVATTSSEIALRNTRAVLCRVRNISLVSRSVASTSACLMLSWMGASWVTQKRVPMLMPSAPSASAAAMPRPSAMPPDAMIGMRSLRAATGSSTRPGTSSSPGWPAHSKPSTDTASTPLRSAESAWRTEVHLWTIFTSWRFRASMKSFGLLPAVSTIFTPLSMMACTYSAYGGGFTAGRIVRFTPKGLSVIVRVRAISWRRSSGVGCVSAVRMPRPPAFDTAAASSARPTHCMPPWMMG